jgi:hypothetical protein
MIIYFNKTFFYCLVLGLSCLRPNFAIALDLQTAPSRPEKIQDNGLLYKAFKTIASDVDASLADQHISIYACTYRSFPSNEEFSYEGLGPCLFQDFKESMKTSSISGVIYAWGKTPWGDLSPIRIIWRPGVSGWWKAMMAWFDLSFERVFVLLKSERQLSDGDLVGTMDFYFNANFPVQNLKISTSPVRRQNGILEMKGELQFISDHWAAHSGTIKWRTNFNPVRRSRPFFLKGNGDSGAEQK